MNKDFSKAKLLEMNLTKQFRTLYELASFIQQNNHQFESGHFQKLKKYHSFLDESKDSTIQKLNKEFMKIKQIDYQFEIYLMNLERLLGQSKKEYEFLIKTEDKTLIFKEKNNIICLLDSILSAHNVGSMLRNAECFHIQSVIMTGLTPPGDHPQVIKTAMGCDKTVSWEYHKGPISYINFMKEQGYQVWSIETGKNAISIKDINSPPQKIILLFGHEQFGLSLELLQISDKIVKIELFGQKNSLNVSISQGIVLSHLV